MLYIVYNPYSGHGTESAGELESLLSGSGISYSLSTMDGFYAGLDPDSFNDDDAILLIGGDGSMNRFINSVPGKLPAPVILMPSGSGNDFARGTGIKKGAANALKAYTDNRAPEFIDEGIVKIDGHEPIEFTVSCGIGYDAGVCHELNSGSLKKTMSRFGLGNLSYIILGVKGIFTYKRAGVTLTLPGKRIRLKDLAFLSCHNLPYEGGGFAFAPGADPRDGKLEITAVTAPNRFIFLLTLVFSLFKMHTRLPWVHTFSCSRAIVESDTPLPFHTDGEDLPDVTSFKVKALPGHLHVLF